MTTAAAESPLQPKDTTTNRLDQLLGDLRKLPLMPASARQAMALANEENVNLRELSGLLEKDVTLAASILKLANSPLFNWGQPVDSLDKAVVRLGARECRSVIVAISMRNVFNETDAATKSLCAVLWHHCFLTACLCRRLNRELRGNFQGEEFTGGLLHDLGRILLAVTVPKHFPAADTMDFAETAETLHREYEVLQTDHCQLGAHYAQQNSLPMLAVSAISYHHSVDEAPENKPLISLVGTADHMANHLQRGDDPRVYDVKQNPAFAVLTVGWSSEKRDSFARFLPPLMTETTIATKQQENPRRSSTMQPRPSLPPATQPPANKTLWGNVRSKFGL